MLVCAYRKKGINIAHIWFNDQSTLPEVDADLLFIHGCCKDESIGRAKISLWQNTLISDLTEDDICAKISRDTKRQIRRAEEDQITTCLIDSKVLADDRQLVRELGTAYEDMFIHKGRKIKFNYDLMHAYIKSGVITLSTASYANQKIVFHTYIVGEDRVRAVHSVSTFRDGNIDSRIIGRANKYLHYRDMLYFKNSGVLWYDWGGISSFDEPNGIDKFKLEFGGQKVTYSNIIIGQTPIGKAVVQAHRILANRAKILRQDKR